MADNPDTMSNRLGQRMGSLFLALLERAHPGAWVAFCASPLPNHDSPALSP